jgi:hypothetical protein
VGAGLRRGAPRSNTPSETKLSIWAWAIGWLAGVAVAHVRRVALDARGNPAVEGDDDAGFSEMALYVLVRRGAAWWLAAGQNTPIRLADAPSRS